MIFVQFSSITLVVLVVCKQHWNKSCFDFNFFNISIYHIFDKWQNVFCQIVIFQIIGKLFKFGLNWYKFVLGHL